MSKHLSEYTRKELMACLEDAGFGIELRDNTTENLREILNQLITDGDAPTIEESINNFAKAEGSDVIGRGSEK